MKKLIEEITTCTLCKEHLPFGTRPIVAASISSKIVIIGQAPGALVHKTGIPWGDKSGENLRSWMAVKKEDFYDTKKFAIIPMGFCYPGKGKSGDLKPRKECAPFWHEKLLDQLKEVELILLIGSYAQEYYLKPKLDKNLTDTVKNYRKYLPKYFVLPHPSPRNNIWQAKNEWFKHLVVPELQREIARILSL